MYKPVSYTHLDSLSVYEANGLLVSQQGSGRYVKKPDLGAQITASWSLYIKAKPTLLLDLLDIRAMLDICLLYTSRCV